MLKLKMFVLHLSFTLFFFSSRRRHTRWPRDWSSDVCSSDLVTVFAGPGRSLFGRAGLLPFSSSQHVDLQRRRADGASSSAHSWLSSAQSSPSDSRSEERRVGKEWRSRRGAARDKKRRQEEEDADSTQATGS